MLRIVLQLTIAGITVFFAMPYLTPPGAAILAGYLAIGILLDAWRRWRTSRRERKALIREQRLAERRQRNAARKDKIMARIPWMRSASAGNQMPEQPAAEPSPEPRPRWRKLPWRQ